MTYITEKSEFTGDDVPLLDTTTPVMGYDGTDIGPANEQAQILANRTKWLKDGLEQTNKTVSSVSETSEKIKVSQDSMEKRLATVEDGLETADKASVSRDNQLSKTIQDQKRALDTDISALDYQLSQLDSRESTHYHEITTTLSSLSTTVTKLSDKNDTIITTIDSLTKQVTTASTDVDDLRQKLIEVDEREASDFETLKIGLSQSNYDIGQNTEAIQGLKTTADDLNTSIAKTDKKADSATQEVEKVKESTATLQSEFDTVKKSVDTLQTNVDAMQEDVENAQISADSAATKARSAEQAVSNLTDDVNGLSESKQDKLVSGTNINTVFGIDVTSVKDGGITLSDAKDFVAVMKSHLVVGTGLSMEESSDGQTLTLTATSGGNGGGLGSNLIVQSMTVSDDQSVEFKTKQRPGYNLRTLVYKSSNVPAQSNLSITFDTDPNSDNNSPYEGDGTLNRISIVPDTTSTRWSSLNILGFDNKSQPTTHLAISPDGDNWYTYSTEKSEWVELGKLKADQASADILVNQGITLQDFGKVDTEITAKWLAAAENPPMLNLAFANSVSSADQTFVPTQMVATFDRVNTWALQPLSTVPISITPDSIIFKPSTAGDYVFCYELLK